MDLILSTVLFVRESEKGSAREADGGSLGFGGGDVVIGAVRVWGVILPIQITKTTKSRKPKRLIFWCLADKSTNLLFRVQNAILMVHLLFYLVHS